MTHTLGSLFDGVAGFPLAFSRAGVATRWVVEIDRDCRRVSARHFPAAQAFGDVRDCHAGADGNLAPVDIITGGFPCTDLSVAGRRAGLAGAHSGLFFEIVRIVREMREATDGACPNYVLLENVPGLYSANARRDFAVVISQLIGLGAVDVGFRICDAQHWGLAQRRRRVFIVLRFGDGPSTAQILALSAGGGRDSAPRRAAGEGTPRGATNGAGVSFKKRGGYGWSESEGVTGTLESEGGSHQGGPERVPLVGILDQRNFAGVGMTGALTGGTNAAHLGPAVAVPELAYCLAAGAGGSKFGSGRDGQDTFGDEGVTHALTGEGFDASEDGTGRGTPLVPVVGELALSAQRVGQLAHREDVDTLVPVAFSNRGIAAETPETLRAASHGALPMVAYGLELAHQGSGGNVGRANPHSPTRTLDASGPPGVAVAFTERTRAAGRNVEAQEELAYSLNNPGEGGRTQEHRVVTPTMAVRRLTPLECCRLQGSPDWWLDDLGLSDSQQYRMLGNAIAVPVVEWLARRLVGA